MALNRICRTCDVTNSAEIIQLNSCPTKYCGKMLMDLLKEVTNINIGKEHKEKLPQFICCTCVRKLQNAYDFVIQAHEANTQMLDFLNDINTECLQEVPMEFCTEQLLDIQLEEDSYAESIKCYRQSKDLKLHFLQHTEGHNINNSMEVVAETDGITQLQCPQCDKSYQLQGRLNNHIRDVHIDGDRKKKQCKRKFLCTVCGKDFARSDKLKRHMLIHNGLKPHKCTVCGKCYRQSKDLKLHFLQHTGNHNIYNSMGVVEETDGTGQLQCSHDISYQLQGRLNNTIYDVHIDGDRMKTKFLCSLCEKELQSAASLDRHMRRHTGDKPFKCDMCEMAFTLNYEMLLQRRKHTGEKPYHCTVCGKDFARSDKLKRHMLIHSGLKPHKCIVCNKCYRQSKDLKLHFLQHTGQHSINNSMDVMVDTDAAVQLQCPHCDKSYQLQGRLENHIRDVHIDSDRKKRKFLCSLCGKVLQSASSLERHMLIHSGLRPHKCTFCEKCYRQSKDLKLHILQHTGETHMECNICGERFIQNVILEKHRMMHGHF